MRLQAAIQGDLQALLKAELRGAERAVTAGVRAATLGLKTELRGQITGAGLGTRLVNTLYGAAVVKSQMFVRFSLPFWLLVDGPPPPA